MNRDLILKKNVLKSGQWTHKDCFKEKVCEVCGNIFKPKSGVHKFCSETCKGKWKYITGEITTESQYKYISGNWSRYFSRLCCRSNKREQLTVNDLLDIYNKQQGLCALSGVPLTCILSKGNICQTNASLDRIQAGAPYTKENVQLVCTVLNSFRRNTEVNEFINWCKKVSEYSDRKK